MEGGNAQKSEKAKAAGKVSMPLVMKGCLVIMPSIMNINALAYVERVVLLGPLIKCLHWIQIFPNCESDFGRSRGVKGVMLS
ncbi:hypothetical protein CFP56_013052 [Quercus suber]|uniref:Uncharacterized protein n=1 Tax=Quercus suber TaxID=58331 RepID=A0AAW0M5C9_QUESU